MTGRSRPPNRDTASRVQDALRLGGLAIAVTQGVVLPLLNYLTADDVPISLPAITLAATMMGIGQAVKITRDRRSPS